MNFAEEKLRPLKTGAFILRLDRDKLRKGLKQTKYALYISFQTIMS